MLVDIKVKSHSSIYEIHKSLDLKSIHLKEKKIEMSKFFKIILIYKKFIYVKSF